MNEWMNSAVDKVTMKNVSIFPQAYRRGVSREGFKWSSVTLQRWTKDEKLYSIERFTFY